MSAPTSVPRTAKALPLSPPTVRNTKATRRQTSIGHLVDLGILSEITGKRRDRIFLYDKYIETLSEGAEPIG